MASPGQLVECISDAVGVPAATVVVHDRNLVKAGLRSKGGRGWSAADVSARDAAHLITALLGSDHVKDSVATVARYEATQPDLRRSNEGLFSTIDVDGLSDLDAGHSFIDAVEALILTAGANATFAAAEPLVDITAMSPATLGTVRLAGVANGMTASVVYITEPPASGRGGQLRKAGQAQAGDLSQYRRITYRTIQRIAHLLK